jgi:polysaccharide export outer membrane protein
MKALLAIASVCLCGASVARAQEPAPRDTKPVPSTTAAAAPRAADAVIPANDDGDYKIGPEDVLDISVWKNQELSRTVPVRPDGKVSMPLVNDIQAAGLTPSRLRQELTRRLSEFVPSPEVAVIVREVHSAKVSVVGAVRSPGRYEVRSPATVLELIALAQGFTDFASRERIVVLRQNGTPARITFNYRKIADGTDQDNFFVQAGDIIVVP